MWSPFFSSPAFLFPFSLSFFFYFSFCFFSFARGTCIFVTDSLRFSLSCHGPLDVFGHRSAKGKTLAARRGIICYFPGRELRSAPRWVDVWVTGRPVDPLGMAGGWWDGWCSWMAPWIQPSDCVDDRVGEWVMTGCLVWVSWVMGGFRVLGTSGGRNKRAAVALGCCNGIWSISLLLIHTHSATLL